MQRSSKEGLINYFHNERTCDDSFSCLPAQWLLASVAAYLLFTGVQLSSASFMVCIRISSVQNWLYFFHRERPVCWDCTKEITICAELLLSWNHSLKKITVQTKPEFLNCDSCVFRYDCLLLSESSAYSAVVARPLLQFSHGDDDIPGPCGDERWGWPVRTGSIPAADVRTSSPPVPAGVCRWECSGLHALPQTIQRPFVWGELPLPDFCYTVYFSSVLGFVFVGFTEAQHYMNFVFFAGERWSGAPVDIHSSLHGKPKLHAKPSPPRRHGRGSWGVASATRSKNGSPRHTVCAMELVCITLGIFAVLRMTWSFSYNIWKQAKRFCILSALVIFHLVFKSALEVRVVREYAIPHFWKRNYPAHLSILFRYFNI